jgi:hypothetical protein
LNGCNGPEAASDSDLREGQEIAGNGHWLGSSVDWSIQFEQNEFPALERQLHPEQPARRGLECEVTRHDNRLAVVIRSGIEPAKAGGFEMLPDLSNVLAEHDPKRETKIGIATRTNRFN